MLFHWILIIKYFNVRAGRFFQMSSIQQRNIGTHLSRNCLFFWLFVDLSVVGGDGMVVEQFAIFILVSSCCCCCCCSCTNSIQSLFHIICHRHTRVVLVSLFKYISLHRGACERYKKKGEALCIFIEIQRTIPTDTYKAVVLYNTL